MTFAVVPILYGPIQVLLALLPALLMMLGGAFLALFKPSTFKQSVRLFWRLKVPLLLGAACVYGVYCGIRAMMPKPAVLQAEAAVSTWSQFRGGAQRLGALPGSPPPLSGGVNWSFNSEMKCFYSSPSVVGNRIYCTGSEKTAFTDKGAVYCLDADTGGLVWKSAPEGFRATFSSPSVSGKYLVVGEGLHTTNDARVFCLDIEQQGKLLWSHRTTNHVESTACIADGRVCIGAGDDGYYCFALEPDAKGKAQVLWHATHEKYPDSECDPGYYDGKFYVGLGLRGNAFVCLDAKTGAEAWRIATPYPVFAPPTLFNGKAYIGMGNGDFIRKADEFATKELDKLKAEGATPAQLAEAAEKLKEGGEVWCIDLSAANHDVLWKFKVGDVVLSGLALADDNKLYFGARNGNLYMLSAKNGDELGRWNAGAPILASPSVAGNYVYVVKETGKIYALERHKLTLEWDTALDGGSPILSSPAIARGHIYLGSIEAGLRCLGVPAEPKGKPAWAGALGGPGRPGHLGQAELPERGTLIWRWPADPAEGAAPPTPKITAPVAILDDLLCVPVAEGAQRGLVALANDSQAAPVQRWQFPTPNGVWLSPAIVPPTRQPRSSVNDPDGGTPQPKNITSPLVFVADGKRGDANRQLHCLDAAKGEPRWHAAIDADASGEFVVLGDNLLVQCGAKDVACYSMGGELCWKKPLGPWSGVPAHQHDMAAIAQGLAHKLTLVDLPTGRELWSIEVPVVTGPAVENSIVYVGTENGVAAYKLLDGSALWSARSAAPAQPLLLNDGRLATMTGGGEMLLINAKTGEIISTTPGANAAFSPLLTGDAIFYFAGKENLMRMAIGQTGGQRWMTAARLGAATSPPVASESCLFFATERRGLLKVGKAP